MAPLSLLEPDTPESLCPVTADAAIRSFAVDVEIINLLLAFRAIGSEPRPIPPGPVHRQEIEFLIPGPHIRYQLLRLTIPKRL